VSDGSLSSAGRSGHLSETASRFGSGFAAVGPHAADLTAATRLAIEAATLELDAPPDLLAVFASGTAVDELGAVGPQAQELSGARHMIGCSAAGVCGAGEAVLGDAAVSVWAAAIPDLTLRAFHLEVMRTEDGLAVVGLPESRTGESTALLFADPYSFPVVSFIDRADQALPGVSLVGGLAGGPGGAGTTRLYLDGRSFERGAVGIMLGGTGDADGRQLGQVVVSQGCRPVGQEMIVTRAEGNLLLELAGVPALQQLHGVLTELGEDERRSFSNGPQIGVAMDEYADEHELGDYLIRAVIGIDEGRQAVAVGDIVEVGRTVRFQLRDADAARSDLRSRLLPAGPAKGALLISCNGRGPAMFGRADSDVRLTQECLGGAAVAGLFAGGEIGPVGDRSWLHGFTASVLAFR
jgi:small ligand-binding sensory domain FIST